MFSAIIANLGTLFVGALLLAVVIGVIALMHRDKVQGKSSCAHGCDHCAMHGQCHQSVQRAKQ